MKNLILAFNLFAAFGLVGQKEIPAKDVSKNDTQQSFPVVEKMPIVVGCEEYANSSLTLQKACFNNAMIKLVSENYKFPDAARRAGLSTKIYINFVIEKDGTISNVEVLKGAADKYKDHSKKTRKKAKELDQEAIRVVKLIKIAEPGTQRGKPIRVQYSMPFNLKLK
jgi:protein TonB